MDEPACALNDCDANAYNKTTGYCRPHYRAFKNQGDPYQRFAHRDCLVCGETFTPQTSPERSCPGCRATRNAQMQQQYRDTHKERIRENNQRFQAANPDYSKVSNKLWRQNNAEAYKAYYTRYRIENLEMVREKFARWEAANPNHTVDWVKRNRERARENVRRRRARLKAVPTFEVTAKDIQRLLARFRNCCAYCNEPLTASYHIDHVMPITLGGSNGVGNLVPACQSCNISKSNWTLSEWRYRDRLSKPLTRRTPTHTRVA